MPTLTSIDDDGPQDAQAVSAANDGPQDVQAVSANDGLQDAKAAVPDSTSLYLGATVSSSRWFVVPPLIPNVPLNLSPQVVGSDAPPSTFLTRCNHFIY